MKPAAQSVQYFLLCLQAIRQWVESTGIWRSHKQTCLIQESNLKLLFEDGPFFRAWHVGLNCICTKNQAVAWGDFEVVICLLDFTMILQI